MYQSADGSIEEITLFADATSNLDDLVVSLGKKVEFGSSRMTTVGTTAADVQLLELAREVGTRAGDLRGTLQKIKLKRDGRRRRALDQSLRSMLEQSRINEIKQKLNELRKQIDTTLLVAIRYVRRRHPIFEAHACMQPGYSRWLYCDGKATSRIIRIYRTKTQATCCSPGSQLAAYISS